MGISESCYPHAGLDANFWFQSRLRKKLVRKVSGLFAKFGDFGSGFRTGTSRSRCRILGVQFGSIPSRSRAPILGADTYSIGAPCGFIPVGHTPHFVIAN